MAPNNTLQKWAATNKKFIQQLLLSLVMMITLNSYCTLFIQPSQQQEVFLKYFPGEGKLTSSDPYFQNKVVQSGYCSTLFSNYAVFGGSESAFCYSDATGVTIYLAHGFSMDAITSSTDASGRFLRIEHVDSLMFKPTLEFRTSNPSKNSYLVVSALTTASFIPAVALKYSFYTNDAQVNQYITKRYGGSSQIPTICIPLTELSLSGSSSLSINAMVNSTTFNLFGQTTLTLLGGVSSDRRNSLDYSKYYYKCNNYNCMIETVVNETVLADSMSIEYHLGTNHLPSFQNFQMARLSLSQLTPVSGTTNTLKTKINANEEFTTTIDTSSFSLSTGYYLKNGNKVHSVSRPITITLASRDDKAFPLEAISSIRWTLNVATTGVDFNLFTNKRFLALPANIFTNDQVVITATLGTINQETITLNTVLDILSIVNGTTLVMDEPSPYVTSGTILNLVTFINVAKTQISSVSFTSNEAKLISVVDAASSASGSEIKIYVKTDAPGKLNIKQKIVLQSGIQLYNYITTQVMPRTPLVGGCSLSPNYGNAYDHMFSIYCPMALDESKFSSIRVEVFEGTDKILTLSNTKNANLVSRLPYSYGSRAVSISITDNYGYTATSQISYSADVNSNSFPTVLPDGIDKINYLLQQNKARNFQTANNYAILLNLFTNKIIPNVVSAQLDQYSLKFSAIFDYTISELDIIRRTVFHSTAYDKAVPLLAPLLREIIDLADKLGSFSTLISSKKQILVQNAEFLLTNDKSGLLSTRDLSAITRILSQVTPSDQNSYWNVTSHSTISEFNNAFQEQFAKMETMFDQGLDLSTFGFQKLVNKFTTLSEMASTRQSISGLTVQMPTTSLFDNGYPSSHYSLALKKLDVSAQTASKYFFLGNGNYSKFCGDVIFSVHVGRSDNTDVDVSGLSTPIILTMDLPIDSSLSSQLEKVNLTCRYLDETNNTWSTKGVVTEVVSTQLTLVQVRCKTSHLSTFTVFADYASTAAALSSTLTKTTKSGLSSGEIAAAVVVPVVAVIIVTIVIFGIVGCLVVRMKKKSKSADIESKPQTQSDSVQFDELKIETSSNMFISDYKSLHSNTVNTATSAQSSESQGTSLTTASYTNIVNKKYEILEKIGAGGFGAVFRAKNLFFNRTKNTHDLEYYAIKKIQLSGLSELNDKFKEAVNMFKIRHENLVSLEDAVVDESTNSLYLVMKFYGNGDLDHFVKAKRLLPEKVLRQIIIQVCRGLKYLEEERSLIHRDIKPSNIFVDVFDPEKELIQVVVSDFGLAKESNMMTSVSFAGTPFFMSPQALIGSKYSFNADIFSLGCSIYLMITHDMSTSIAQLYFQKQGNAGLVHEYIRDQIVKAMKDSSIPAYSDEFLKILLCLLEFDADVRPCASKVLELFDNVDSATTMDVIDVV